MIIEISEIALIVSKKYDPVAQESYWLVVVLIYSLYT